MKTRGEDGHGRAQERRLEEPTLLTPCSWASGLQNREGKCLPCKPPRVVRTYGRPRRPGRASEASRQHPPGLAWLQHRGQCSLRRKSGSPGWSLRETPRLTSPLCSACGLAPPDGHHIPSSLLCVRGWEEVPTRLCVVQERRALSCVSPARTPAPMHPKPRTGNVRGITMVGGNREGASLQLQRAVRNQI